MSKYISEDCKWCEEHDSMYGCMAHQCEIYQDYLEGRAEMAADEEHDRRKDDRLEDQGVLW